MKPSNHALRVLLLACAASSAFAQTYPVKPIRMVVGFAPGGANDTIARILAPELNKALAQTVIVDNRPGAGGTVGAEVVAKAPSDGHTLLLGSTGTNGIAPSLYSKLSYDQMKDLAPVTLVARSANLVVVNPSLPAKNIRELIALAKAQPGKMNYASSGVGSTLHLAMELFKSMAGVDIVHVPYKGDALAMADVMVQIATQGVETASNTPAEFRAFVASEIAKWGKVVKAVGVKID